MIDTVYRLHPEQVYREWHKIQLVYVCGPYSDGDTVVNVRNAILMGEELVKADFTPYIPHLTMLWHAIAPHNYEFWLEYDMKWLDRCDALLRLPGESFGSDREVDHSNKMGIPVFYSVEELCGNQ